MQKNVRISFAEIFVPKSTKKDNWLFSNKGHVLAASAYAYGLTQNLLDVSLIPSEIINEKCELYQWLMQNRNQNRYPPKRTLPLTHQSDIIVSSRRHFDTNGSLRKSTCPVPACRLMTMSMAIAFSKSAQLSSSSSLFSSQAIRYNMFINHDQSNASQSFRHLCRQPSFSFATKKTSAHQNRQ